MQITIKLYYLFKNLGCRQKDPPKPKSTLKINNTDTFRELQLNNTNTFSEFTPSNADTFTDILSNNTDFSVLISSNIFRELLRNTLNFFQSSYQGILTLLQNYCQTILTFLVFTSNNFSTFQFHRITAKQYWLFPDKQYCNSEGVTTKKQWRLFSEFPSSTTDMA